MQVFVLHRSHQAAETLLKWKRTITQFYLWLIIYICVLPISSFKMFYCSNDEKVILLKACYDNPVFGENQRAKVPAVRIDGQEPGTKELMVTHTPARQDNNVGLQQFIPLDGITVKMARKHRTNRLWILLALLITLITVAVVVVLLVHFLGKLICVLFRCNTCWFSEAIGWERTQFSSVSLGLQIRQIFGWQAQVW